MLSFDVVTVIFNCCKVGFDRFLVAIFGLGFGLVVCFRARLIYCFVAGFVAAVADLLGWRVLRSW